MNGRLIHVLTGNRGPIYGVSISPDNQWVVAGSDWYHGQITVWDAVTGTLVRELPGHTFDTWDTLFSPDGTYLASAGGWADPTLKIWRVSDWQLHATLSAPSSGGDLLCLAWSKDQRYIAAGSRGGRVFIWRTDTWELLSSWQGSSTVIGSISLSPDNTKVCTGDHSGMVRVWQWSDGTLLHSFRLQSGVALVRFIANDLIVVINTEQGETLIRLYHLEDGLLRQWTIGYADVATADVSADGRFIAVSLWLGNYSEIRFYHLSLGKDYAPAPPTNLRAFALSSTKIQLDWKDNSTGEQGFEIERKGESGDYTVIARVGANVTTYTDTGLSPQTTYTYRVRAYNAAGKSPYSNPASATTCSGDGLLQWTLNMYRANLHSHSSYSDGKWLLIGYIIPSPVFELIPWDVFYSAYTNGWELLSREDHWDVWAVTDHAEQLSLQEWDNTLAQASSVMGQFPTFTALRGFEWTGHTETPWNPFDLEVRSGGHINVIGSTMRVGAYLNPYNLEKYPIDGKDVRGTLQLLYSWLADSSNKAIDGGTVVAQFNHPSTYDDSSHFALAGEPFRLPDFAQKPEFRNQLLKVFALMELGSHVPPWQGGYEGGQQNFLTWNEQAHQSLSSEYWFRRALRNGWHVAPVNNGDNHNYTWTLTLSPDSEASTTFPQRLSPMTGIWAEPFGYRDWLDRTKVVLDTLRHRRVFSSEDLATRLTFQARLKSKGRIVQDGWYWMGSTFEMPSEADEIELNVWVRKEDAMMTDYIWKVEIFVSPDWRGSEYENRPIWPSLDFSKPAYARGTAEVNEWVSLTRAQIEKFPRNALGEVYMYVRVQIYTLLVIDPDHPVELRRLLYSAPIWIRGLPPSVPSPPGKEPL